MHFKTSELLTTIIYEQIVDILYYFIKKKWEKIVKKLQKYSTYKNN